jgi:uncharacterized metal-binding protein
MSDGRTHTRATLIATGVVGVAGTAAVVAGYLGPADATAIALGCLAGTVLTPDLDVDGGCIAFHNMRWAFGYVVGAIWRTIWWPYAVLVRHRSFISHFPVIGTLGRVAYLVGLATVLHLLFDVPLDRYLGSGMLRVSIVGLMISDAIHGIMDVVSTETKRRRRKR